MLIGPRPTLGWVGYLMLGGSWYRLAVIMVLFGFATISIVQEGRHSITLHYTRPVPFPPPVMFLPSPAHTKTTALDACSVEAAGVDLLNPSDRRRVYVFMWDTSMSPHDVWGRWIMALPKVDVAKVDLPQVVNQTPLEKLAKHRRGRYPDWNVWTATRVAMLWTAGGMVLPLGAIMKTPILVEAHGARSGLVVANEDGSADPILMSIPAHHPVLFAMAGHLMNATAGNQADLLTKALKEQCGVDKMQYLSFSDCNTFTVLKGRPVAEFGAEGPTSHRDDKTTVLLRYTGDAHLLQDPNETQQVFQKNSLHHYCPLTAKFVEAIWRESL